MIDPSEPGLTTILLKLKPAFLRELNAAVRAYGRGNRLQFIRDAILEKIQRMGIPIDPTLAGIPAQFSRDSEYPEYRQPIPALNEAPLNSSDLDQVAKAANKAAEQLTPEEAALLDPSIVVPSPQTSGPSLPVSISANSRSTPRSGRPKHPKPSHS